MAEAVKVCVRCRPMNTKEKNLKCKKIVRIHKDLFQVQLLNPGNPGSEPKAFTFDSVFDDDSTQDGVYQETAYSLVLSVMDGYNGTIFAYGQTGCGKTFTMEGVRNGPPELRGIIPGTFEQVFRTIDMNTDPDKQFLVQAMYLEIYNEEVRDLVGVSPKSPLDLKEDPEVGVYVKGLSKNTVRDVDAIMDLMEAGNKNRSVGFTLMNAGSSRSHSIFMVRIETSVPDESKPGDLKIKAGKLNLVDLAGSERQNKTGAEGTRLKEATKINLSLSALGNVISSLVAGKGKHIPYRDSKLTRLLQDSLGGNTKTIMIAALSPADYNYEETISTLRYANRAKNIKNKPKINEDPKDAMLREFADEIAKLKAILAAEGLEDTGPAAAPKPKKAKKAKKPKKPKAKKLKKELEVQDFEEDEDEEDEEDEEESEEEEEEEVDLENMTPEEKAEHAEKQKVLQSKMSAELARAKQDMEAQIQQMSQETKRHEQQAMELQEKMQAEREARAALVKEKEEMTHMLASAPAAAATPVMDEQAKARVAAAAEEINKHQEKAAELREKMYDEHRRHDELKQSIEEAKLKMKEEKLTLKEKLKELQQKLVQGGQRATDIQLRRQEEIKAHAARVEEERRAQIALREQAEHLEDGRLVVEEKYSSVMEALKGKTEKLRKLRHRLKETEEERLDLLHEFEGEREGYLDNIRSAFKELRLHKRIAEQFLLRTDIEQIVKLSVYMETTSVWKLPKIELPVSLPKLGTSRNTSQGCGRPEDGRGKTRGSTGPSNNRPQHTDGSLLSAAASDAGWGKSVVATQREYEWNSRQTASQDTTKARSRSKSPAPARLRKMEAGAEAAPAIRPHASGSEGGLSAMGASLGASRGGALQQDRGALPDSVNNVRARANFDVKKPEHHQVGQQAFDLQGMDLPVARPHFKVDDSETRKADQPDIQESMSAVPRRSNFEGGFKPEKENDSEAFIERMDNVPRRKNFNATKPSSMEQPAAADAAFSAMTRVPQRANFNADRSALDKSKSDNQEMFSTMDTLPRRKKFGGGQVDEGKGHAQQTAFDAFSAMDGKRVRGQFEPGGSFDKPPTNSSIDSLTQSVPSRPSFNPDKAPRAPPAAFDFSTMAKEPPRRATFHPPSNGAQNRLGPDKGFNEPPRRPTFNPSKAPGNSSDADNDSLNKALNFSVNRPTFQPKGLL